MRFKIFFLVFSIFFSSSLSFVHSADRYDGPKTVEQAKERFFKNRQLSKIEGIWYDEGENAYYAITKRDNLSYDKWTISHKIPKYNGTLDIAGNVLKTATPNIFIYKTTVYNIYKPSEEYNASATMFLEGNLLTYQIKSFLDDRGKKWNFDESNLLKVWPLVTQSSSKNSNNTNVDEKVFFNGEYYKKHTSSDYKTISGGKRDCTEFYSKKYYYYLCESSTRFSFSKEFLKNDFPYNTNDVLRYISFKDGKQDIAYKGSKKYQDDQIIVSGGWIDDKGVFYGVRNEKTKKWIAYHEEGKSYQSDIGLSETEVKKSIDNSKKYFNDAIQVKKDVEELLGKQIVKSKFKSNQSKKIKKQKNLNDFKQYWWVIVLVAVGAFFVYMHTTKGLNKTKRITKKTDKNSGPIRKFFNGDVDLTTSFWGIYFGVGLVLGLLFFSIEKNETLAGLFSLFILLPYTIFAMIGTWRSASKYKIEKQKKKEGTGWGTAAQVYIVLSVFRGVVEIIKEFN